MSKSDGDSKQCTIAPQPRELRIGQGIATVFDRYGGKLTLAAGTTRARIQQWLEQEKFHLLDRILENGHADLSISPESNEVVENLRAVLFLQEQEKTMTSLASLLDKGT